MVSNLWSWIYWGGDGHIRGRTAIGRSVVMYANFSMSRPQNGIEWSEGRANKGENHFVFCKSKFHLPKKLDFFFPEIHQSHQ